MAAEFVCPKCLATGMLTGREPGLRVRLFAADESSGHTPVPGTPCYVIDCPLHEVVMLSQTVSAQVYEVLRRQPFCLTEERLVNLWPCSEKEH